MSFQRKPRMLILVADDDEDDRFLVGEALRRWNSKVDVRFVGDGRELMDYLHTCEADMKGSEKPCPDLVLLDLNMPVKNGREALREIRADTRLKSIPVVILSTSGDQDDIDFCHRLGASSFISKSIDFQDLVSKMNALGSYWFGAVCLPGVHFPADSE